MTIHPINSLAAPRVAAPLGSPQEAAEQGDFNFLIEKGILPKSEFSFTNEKMQQLGLKKEFSEILFLCLLKDPEFTFFQPTKSICWWVELHFATKALWLATNEDDTVDFPQKYEENLSHVDEKEKAHFLQQKSIWEVAIPIITHLYKRKDFKSGHPADLLVVACIAEAVRQSNQDETLSQRLNQLDCSYIKARLKNIKGTYLRTHNPQDRNRTLQSLCDAEIAFMKDLFLRSGTAAHSDLSGHEMKV